MSPTPYLSTCCIIKRQMHSECPFNLLLGGDGFSAGEYGTGSVLIGTNASLLWSWSLLFSFWVSNRQWVKTQSGVTISFYRINCITLPIPRCSSRGAEILWSRAHARRHGEPQCVRPCAHEAVQSPEEPLHLRLLSLPLAVSVTALYNHIQRRYWVSPFNHILLFPSTKHTTASFVESPPC